MKNSKHQPTTHFGYQQVSEQEKASLVAEVFRSVAPKYDLMNDVMSLGMHRLWKHETLAKANLKPGHTVLDVASGTGDLAKAMAKAVTATGKIVMSDINETMLAVGRERMENAGLVGNIEYIQADAEQLPFANHYFDRVTIAFGLRNVTRKDAALAAFYRVLKPGGQLLILEFSKPTHPLLNKVYDFYSFNIIPKMGELITNDRASYQYLVESIRMHPDQTTLKAMMETAGFEDVTYDNFTNGIVALHAGYKY
jgi:demethylmenaquinone methyltransferase/2-methoxy-6-polyprenyl-1,4-benzoquinol methylase